jgi:stage II sporulation protein D
MMMLSGNLKYIYLLLVLQVSAPRSFSLDIRIGVFHEHLVNAILFTPGDGDYHIASDRGNLGICPKGESWYVIRQKDSLFIRDHKGQWHQGLSLRFTAPDEYAFFRLKPALPVLESREYLADLQVEISMKSLLMINEIDMEKYIMGVIETEAGSRCELEYYKVQAILSRTFAFKNLLRHETEGFHLCDAVHCQAYKGRNIWNEDVEIGTEVTEGLILTDRDSVLLNAVYHANSGGETRGAELVWLTGKHYLRPVLDPFSLNQPGAKWEKFISAGDWISYLRAKGIFVGELLDSSVLKMPIKHRQDYYLFGPDSLLLSVIRDDYKLRSDFFGVNLEGDQVVLDGRGYGHGVGLSQEGAMEMARRGYRYSAILNYYYHQIQIIHYMFLLEAGKLAVDIMNLP